MTSNNHDIDFINNNFKFAFAGYIFWKNEKITDIDLKKIFENIQKNEKITEILEYNELKFIKKTPKKDFLEEKNKTEEIRKFEFKEKEESGISYIFEVFKYKSTPSFVKSKENKKKEENTFEEKRIGFILVVAIDKFVFIQKSGGTNSLNKKFFDDLGGYKGSGISLSGLQEEQIDNIIRRKGYNTFSSVGLKNTGITPYQYDSITYSGYDLINLISPSQTGNYINEKMKVIKKKSKEEKSKETKNKNIGLSINKKTSRLYFTNEKKEKEEKEENDKSFDDLMEFYKGIYKQIKNEENIKEKTDLLTFVEDSFVKEVVQKDLIPKFLAFDIFGIEEKLEEMENEGEEGFDKDILYDVLEDFHGYFEIEKENKGEVKYKIGIDKKYEIGIKIDNSIDILLEETKDNQKEVEKLIKIINENHLFRITFSEEESEEKKVYSYGFGNYYELKTFEGLTEETVKGLYTCCLGKCTSEKGEYVDYDGIDFVTLKLEGEKIKIIPKSEEHKDLNAIELYVKENENDIKELKGISTGIKYYPNFAENSIFNKIEEYFGEKYFKKETTETNKKTKKGEEIKPTFKYLICGDMNYELADYIAIDSENQEVIFIHAKVKKDLKDNSKSVSAFHDVVSQALKNIGHLTLENPVSIKKIVELSKGVVNVNIKSGEYGNKNVLKKRLIIPESSESLEKDLQSIKENIFSKRKLVLAINFFDKEFIKNFSKTKENDKILYVQAVNILGELYKACKSRGIKLEIWGSKERNTKM